MTGSARGEHPAPDDIRGKRHRVRYDRCGLRASQKMPWIGDVTRYPLPPPTLTASAAARLATSFASILLSVAAGIASGEPTSASHVTCSLISRAAHTSAHAIAVSDRTHEASASVTSERARRVPLRESLRIAEGSRAEGSHPFGSLVVDARGRIVSSFGNNSLPPHGDPTQHAEMHAVAAAARLRGPDGMRDRPCSRAPNRGVMCAGAVYWTGIDRVVYALSETRMLSLTGAHEENPTLALPCREVFTHGQRTVQVAGPMLEDEAAEAHGF